VGGVDERVAVAWASNTAVFVNQRLIVTRSAA
jgi:hypothetical protein